MLCGEFIILYFKPPKLIRNLEGLRITAYKILLGLASQKHQKRRLFQVLYNYTVHKTQIFDIPFSRSFKMMYFEKFLLKVFSFLWFFGSGRPKKQNEAKFYDFINYWKNGFWQLLFYFLELKISKWHNVLYTNNYVIIFK